MILGVFAVVVEEVLKGMETVSCGATRTIMILRILVKILWIRSRLPGQKKGSRRNTILCQKLKWKGLSHCIFGQLLLSFSFLEARKPKKNNLRVKIRRKRNTKKFLETI